MLSQDELVAMLQRISSFVKCACQKHVGMRRSPLTDVNDQCGEIVPGQIVRLKHIGDARVVGRSGIVVRVHTEFDAGLVASIDAYTV